MCGGGFVAAALAPTSQLQHYNASAHGARDAGAQCSGANDGNLSRHEMKVRQVLQLRTNNPANGTPCCEDGGEEAWWGADGTRDPQVSWEHTHTHVIATSTGRDNRTCRYRQCDGSQCEDELDGKVHEAGKSSAGREFEILEHKCNYTLIPALKQVADRGHHSFTVFTCESTETCCPRPPQGAVQTCSPDRFAEGPSAVHHHLGVAALSKGNHECDGSHK